MKISGANSVKTRVVVAEDESMVTEVIKHLLTSAGCDVAGCAPDANGRTCSQYASGYRLMDIMMSDMDGLEAARRIQMECPTGHRSDRVRTETSRACEAGVSSHL